MHFAVNISTSRWGWVCFRPTTSRWARWYFYISPNATPGASTFAIGPGVDKHDKIQSRENRLRWGHNYDASLYYTWIKEGQP